MSAAVLPRSVDPLVVTQRRSRVFSRPEMDVGKWLEEFGGAAGVENILLARKIDTLGELAAAVCNETPIRNTTCANLIIDAPCLRLGPQVSSQEELAALLQPAGASMELIAAAWAEVGRIRQAVVTLPLRTLSAAEQAAADADAKGRALMIQLAAEAKVADALAEAAAIEAELQAAAAARLGELRAAAASLRADQCSRAIQSGYRAHRRRHTAVALLQATVRAKTARVEYRRVRAATVLVQTRARGKAKLLRFIRVRGSALLLQRLWRGASTRGMLGRRHAAARSIQRAILPMVRRAVAARAARDRFFRMYAAIALQAWARGLAARATLRARKAGMLVLQVIQSRPCTALYKV